MMMKSLCAFGFFIFGLVVQAQTSASVNYADFSGEFDFVSGTGSTADCLNGISVQPDSVHNEILIYTLVPAAGTNGFLAGFFNINLGPQNECCAPSDLFYHHDDNTVGSGDFVKETVQDYDLFATRKNIDLSTWSVGVEGDSLTFITSVQSFQNPAQDHSATCVFKRRK